MITSTPTPSGHGVDTVLATLEATIDDRLARLARREHHRALVRTVAMVCLPATVVAATAITVI